ncbi:PIN-like domain-containing protein [Microbacterium lacticum]|uniref:PIN-like domain-containing protein n=1 Tax=Microbacterium lacticum TaxID=33885 RepID=UPI001F573790|nr:PIN-like domain-containing protein [Microbacterium lacticum]
MSIYDGFEGYRDPTEPEVLDLLTTCPVVLDTNVLLDIYTFEEPARLLALDVIESIHDRVWVPHQVMREFWRNRHSVIAELPAPGQPIESVRSELLAIVNALRPDRERPDDIQAMRETVERQLSELSSAITKARGAPLDIDQLLADTSMDPVLERLETILAGRVGEPLGAEESALIDEGLRRFELKIPPGYKDGEGKREQVPERGTGDFLLWEQALRYVAGQGAVDAFVLVTNDAKEDWRINLARPKKRAIGVRPELVAEALERAGARLVLLQQSEFYRLMAKLGSVDDSVSDSLVEASTLRSSATSDGSKKWPLAAYRRLLVELRENGSLIQADVISLAARAGGFISRSQIYELAGFAEDRSLRRFALPAQRISLALAEEGLLPVDAAPALEAVYEGPGRTTGYRVPQEFAIFESQSEVQLTWVQAAARVAAAEPERVWTITELVEQIADSGLRDLSGARTPEATLRRDLLLRDAQHFEQVDGGVRLRRSPPDPSEPA